MAQKALVSLTLLLTCGGSAAGEARPDAAAWKAWHESTGQPSTRTRR